MKKPNRRTISIASDNRARIPFAMIGVLVLITSTTAVTVLNNQEESSSETPDIGLAMDRTEAATQAATREAVSEGLQEAAQAPVTEPDTSTDVGGAIKGSLDEGDDDYGDAVFQRYIKLRIYLNARERIARTDQRLQDGTTTNATLPPIGDSETEIESTLDSMDMRVGMYDDDVPDGQVQVTIPDVQITVNSENGSQLAQRTTSVNTSVPTTVFQLHEKNQEYQKRLNTGFFEGFNEGIGYGFGQQFAARQYPVSWAKVYFDRFYSGDAAFDPVHDLRDTEILANDAIYAEQKAAFGTTDPYEDRIMKERWTCFALTTAYNLYQVRGTGQNASQTPSTLSDAFNATYVDGFQDRVNNTVNQTLERRVGTHIPDDPTNWNENDICRATRLLFGDNTGNLDEAPQLTDMVDGIFQRSKGDPNNQEEMTVSVDRFADAALYDLRGYDALAEVSSDIEENDESGENANDPQQGGDDDYEAHNTSDFDEPDPGDEASDTRNEIGEIINDTYDARAYGRTVKLREDSLPDASGDSPGSEWDQDGDSYDISTGSLEVESIDMGDSTTENSKITRVQRVEVTITNEITHEQEWEKDRTNKSDLHQDSHDTKDVTYKWRMDIHAEHSLDSSYEKRGVENAFGSSNNPGPNDAPNLEAVRQQAISQMLNSSLGDVESDIASRIDRGDVLRYSDLESEIDYSTSASIDSSLSDSEYRALYNWIIADIRDTRDILEDEIDSVNITRNELVSSSDNLEPLEENVSDRRDEVVEDSITGSNGKYANMKERARIEAQDAYIDSVIAWINDVENEQESSTDSANSKINNGLEGIDSSIDDALTFAQEALAGDVGSPRGSIAGTPQDRDMGIQVSASPSYLSRNSMGQDELPAARAEDEGPLNTSSSASHTGLTIKQDNVFLPHPGFPLIPWPGYWYATLSTWRIQMEGEYARFETQTTTNNPTTSSPTTYVRDERPVDLEINGETKSVGRVNPINFSSTTLVVVIVPSAQVIATGGAGIGDMGSTTSGNWHSCTGKYPHVGPNAADEDKSCTYILDDEN